MSGHAAIADPSIAASGSCRLTSTLKASTMIGKKIGNLALIFQFNSLLLQ
jgi:hypothetical protein